MGQNGVQNLVPANERSKGEARENGKKGGLNSGESRRKKRRIQEALIKALKGKYDVDGDELDGYSAIAVKMVLEAMKGNVQAFKEIRDTVGEIPISEVSVKGNLQFNGGGLKETIETLKKIT